MNYKKSAFLMGTQIEINISTDKNPLSHIYEAFWLIYSYEIEFSRFLTSSSLSLLNQNKTLEVSDRFLEVLKISKEIYTLTSWSFNPLINLWNIWYSETFDNNHFEKVISGDNLDIEKIMIHENHVTLLPTQNIDFGWIVKWYCVDRVADFLISKWYRDFIVNAWGDIYISGKNNGKKWVVWIDNPFMPDQIFASMELENMSVSTSGSYKRNWKIGNNSYHHIINPLNDWICETEIISISLIAPKTYITDTYATACFNMWVKKSLAFLETHNIDSVIITSDNNVYISKGMSQYNFNPF